MLQLLKMSILFNLLVLINTAGLIYLTFIFYKKNTTKVKAGDLIVPDKYHKIKLVKFNPFDDLGGDHSFILSILDNNNDGVIITSLHSRDVTRVYAKPIKNGEGDNVSLSKEEKSAIVKTIKS